MCCPVYWGLSNARKAAFVRALPLRPSAGRSDSGRLSTTLGFQLLRATAARTQPLPAPLRGDRQLPQPMMLKRVHLHASDRSAPLFADGGTSNTASTSYLDLQAGSFVCQSFIWVERKTYYKRMQSEGKMPISLYRLLSGTTIRSLRHNPK